jgi:hypothetical protein
MQNTERRVAALENSASDLALKIVFLLDGETEADALRRAGLPQDARAVFITSLDERL